MALPTWIYAPPSRLRVREGISYISHCHYGETHKKEECCDSDCEGVQMLREQNGGVDETKYVLLISDRLLSN
jgi:hypothetical protein